MSSEGDSDLDSLLRKIGRAPPLKPGAAVVDDRYELGELLGEGSFGAVYEAFDRSRNERVALKLLHRGSSDALLRFKREFRALSRLSDPSFVRLYDLHGSGDRFYFTMERIDGVPFDLWIRDRDKLRPALAGLARALDALHRAGFVHRDVKPSNVLVDAHGRIVLLDFGLVHAPGERSATVMAGTPIYLAPEIARGAAPTAASDRYAVGVMLYEALTGTLPFDGSAEEILAKKRGARPIPVLERAPNAPTDLAALADALLDPDPDVRPPIDGAVAEDAPPPESQRAPFIGRKRELGELEEACREARVVRVFGPSGVGKSALVDRVVTLAREQGAHVLVSRCHPHDHVPFVAVDGLIDALARKLARLPPSIARAIAPVDVDALVRAFPVLRATPGFDVLVPQEGARSRVATALVDLLAHWVDRRRWLLVIDDAQWGDADSAVLLRALRDSALPLAIVLVHRAEMDGPLVEALREEARPIEIGALADSDAHDLARSLGARDAGHAIRESGGHPLFLIALVREQVCGGEKKTLEAIVQARRATLSAAAQHGLELLTIAGSPLTLAVLREAGVANAAQGELRAAGLIAYHDADSVRIVHDRVLDVLTSTIGRTARKGLHRTLAGALLAVAPERAEALAYHLEEAGDPEAAFAHLLRAARDATAARAFARARSLYMRLLAQNNRDAKLRLEAANASARIGLSVEAADGFLAASRMTSGDDAIALRLRAAEQLLTSGHRERGESVLDGELARLGLSIPSSTPGRALGMLRDTVGRKLVDRYLPQRTSEMRLAALWTAFRGAVFIHPMRAMTLAACLTREAARPGATEQGRLAAAFLQAVQPLAGKGPEGLASALAWFDEHGSNPADPLVRHQYEFSKGVMYALGCEHRKSNEALERAIALASEHGLGHTYDETMGRAMLGSNAWIVGDVSWLREHIPALCMEFDERDHLLGWMLSTMHRVWLDAMEHGFSSTKPAVEAAARRFTQRGLDLQGWWLDIGWIHMALEHGDGHEAWRLAAPQATGIRERFLATKFHRLEAQTLLVRAAITIGRRDPKARELAQARKLVSELATVPSTWTRAHAHCLRAGLASVRKDEDEALRALRAARPALDEAGMHLLRTLVDDAIGTTIGGDEGKALVTAARAKLAEWRIDRDRAIACTLPGRW